MDAGAGASGEQGTSGRLDILGDAACETCNHGPLNLLGNRLHRLEVTIADDGESRLDDVNLEARQLAGDLKLLTQVHRGTRALLAITKCRIENKDSVVVHRKRIRNDRIRGRS